MKNTHTYNMAVATIRSHAHKQLEELAAERNSALSTLREAVYDSLRGGDEICALVAQTVTFTLPSGYPQVCVPSETRKVLKAAFRAGFPRQTGILCWKADASAVERCEGITALLDAAVSAWTAHEQYRQVLDDIANL